MTLKIQKLDRRNNGHKQWKYYVNVQPNATLITYKQLYSQIREWCWTTWGASKELNEWMVDSNVNVYCHNEHWCWQNDEYCRRIYLRSDAELVLLKLRWE